MKKLYDISWQVTEPEYRADKALSYSTLARFAREGFNKLDDLFTKIDTPSLTFGSAVDAIITGGQEEFDNNFFVADFPSIGDAILKMVKVAFNKWGDQYDTLNDVPNDYLIALSEELGYQLNWKPETRAKVVKEQGEKYYSLLFVAQDKKIISVTTKQQVDAAVYALKNKPATKFYFASDSPFDTRWSREYQLKFKASFEGVDYRCMADLLATDHENKIVYPIDLKTSSHNEWDFFESFIQWRYDIQARLYWRIIRANMDKDPIFKEYELANYKFIVVNKKTLTPLVWEFKNTKMYRTLHYGKMQQIELEDPFELGKTLSNYLSSRPEVPVGIKSNENETNDIIEWLNKK